MIMFSKFKLQIFSHVTVFKLKFLESDDYFWRHVTLFSNIKFKFSVTWSSLNWNLKLYSLLTGHVTVLKF